MRIRYLLMAAVAVSMFTVSCKKEQKRTNRSEYIRPASMDYSKQDSAEIKQLVGNFVDAFNNKDFKAVSEMLYKVRNDSVLPLSDKEKADYVTANGHINVYGCKMKSIVLRSDKNNEVKLTVQIVSSGDIDKEIGVTHLSLNPVVKDGKWYLTLLDKNAEGVTDVYAPRK